MLGGSDRRCRTTCRTSRTLVGEIADHVPRVRSMRREKRGDETGTSGMEIGDGLSGLLGIWDAAIAAATAASPMAGRLAGSHAFVCKCCSYTARRGPFFSV